MKKDTKYWEDLAQSVEKPTHAFIDGEMVLASDGGVNKNTSPIDGRELGDLPSCSADDANRAVVAARKSFESGEWSGLSAEQRKHAMLEFADIIEQHKDNLIVLDTLDMGKPIAGATYDIEDSIGHFRWMAEAIDKKNGDVIDTAETSHITSSYEPIGVVAAIVPWNYPFNMAMWKMAPAIAAGNSFILKPAEVSSMSMMYLAKLWKESNMPNGAFQVVPGRGSVVGETLARHEDVDVISFTGSTPTARHLLVCSGESNMKRVYVEAGGKSPAVVLADADLDVAIPEIGGGIFDNQGEVCCATSRAIVHESIYEEFMERMKTEAKAWMPSNPFDPDSANGAVVDNKQYNTINKYIETAKQQNTFVDMGFEAEIEANEEFKKGFYIAPTIFTDVKPGDTIFDEEIFGPVLAVSTFKTEEEALALANDSIYGLLGAVFTTDIKSAHKFARGIKAGTVSVNCYGTGGHAVPFGGYKQSGNGRDRSVRALNKYQEVKTNVWNLS